jgi:glutamine amidotransferase
MCRHIARIGAPVSLRSVLVEPAHSLLAQTVAPRHQADGVNNVDGFGVAWYLDGDSSPSRFRTPKPMADDPTLGGHESAMPRAFLAAVRNASPGLALIEPNTAPYVCAEWAFSHNGFVRAFLDRRDELIERVAPERRDGIEGTTDSELLFACVLGCIDDGARPADALAEAITLVGRDDDSKLNLLLTDGDAIWATRWGNSLFTLATADAVVVASEPFDDDDGWAEVPDRSIVIAAIDTITIGAL